HRLLTYPKELRQRVVRPNSLLFPYVVQEIRRGISHLGDSPVAMRPRYEKRRAYTILRRLLCTPRVVVDSGVVVGVEETTDVSPVADFSAPITIDNRGLSTPVCTFGEMKSIQKRSLVYATSRSCKGFEGVGGRA